MVIDEIWGRANLSYHQNVCQPCLEKRLGRKLELADYTTAACNRTAIPKWWFTEGDLELHFSRAQEDWDKAVKQTKFINWHHRQLRFESSQTPQSDQSGHSCSPNPSHPESTEQFVDRKLARRRPSHQAGQDAQQG